MRRLPALQAELHDAFGRTETAMVLFRTLQAGTPVHGKDNDGYDSGLHFGAVTRSFASDGVRRGTMYSVHAA